ncbi:EAL domain-containing protein [Pararhizobium haloflavum]|uniref:EAL domain-containing protein n=1 Tax=Pararhizobium haloflavum TaxID=2037914 RepID=UPI000C18FFB3|nr:EAL domain-containing protein [Pararhizobium haloflavum]
MSTNLPPNIVREDDGTYAAIYGPFALHTAFQPIFRQNAGGGLRLQAFEGLIRPSKSGVSCPPFALFRAVSPEDRGMVDALCRRLHMLNMGQMNRPGAALFLNFDPSLFEDARTTAREADSVCDLAYQIGLAPHQVVCEITEKKAHNRSALVAIVEDFRERGFRVAVDDYGAAESDIDRIELLRPDIVKFDGEWVLRYMEHQPGIDLLKETAARFRANGITTLFEGLEESWQVDLAISMKIDLFQGYAIAKPQMLPTTFATLFPIDPDPEPRVALDGASLACQHQREDGPALAAIAASVATAPVRRPPRRTFGRRGG